MRSRAAAIFAVTLATLMFASSSAYAANGNFRSMTRLTTADFFDPRGIAVADFNGDSDPDLAVASEASNEVWILLGGSGASFSPPTKFSAGGSPHAIAVGDFNGDSDPDLAVTNFNSRSVSILIGGPGGSFAAATDLAVGGRPVAVAAGFFDDDSDQDLAVAVRTTNPPNFGNVSIFLGEAGGRFTGPTEVDVGQGPGSVAVADFNGDTHADLAVGLWISGRIAILLGDGRSNFTINSRLEVGGTQRDIAAGDFNSDSDPDMVATVKGGVMVFLGLPGAGFTQRVTFSGTYDPDSIASSVAVGDFNGDADPDLAVGDPEADNVSILSGGVGGTFTSPARFAAGDVPGSVAVGDFNGDSELDIAAANPRSRDVAILRGGGGSSFSGPTNHIADSGVASVLVRDFNGDRDPDLAVGGVRGISIFTGGRGGSFKSGETHDGGYSSSVAAGDFNGDSDLDLAVADQSAGVSILVGAAGASFSGPSTFDAGPGPPTGVAVGDFNGDSDADLAVVIDAYPPGNNQNLSILFGGAGASFSEPTTYASAGPSSVAVGDFNGDRDPDLAVGIYSGVEVRLGAAGGSFRGRRIYETGRGDTSVAVGDFTRDADPDLAVANKQSHNVSILIGGEGGTFTKRNTKWLGRAEPTSVVVGNFNGDKDPDLAVANAPSYLRGDVSVFLGGPGAAFSGPKNFQPGYDPVAVRAGDFNGDSDPDLVVANRESQSVTVMLAIGPP